MQQSQLPPISIYRYAAREGVAMGAYLTATSFSLLLSLRFPWMELLILPLILGFPAVLAILMKRIADAEPAYRRLASLWLGGIYTVIFGTLICTLLSALWLRFADPSFIFSYVCEAITRIEASPLAPDYADTVALMRSAIDRRLLPNGMEFVSTLAWATAFLGSMASLLIAFALTLAGRRKAPA